MPSYTGCSGLINSTLNISPFYQLPEEVQSSKAFPFAFCISMMRIFLSRRTCSRLLSLVEQFFHTFFLFLLFIPGSRGKQWYGEVWFGEIALPFLTLTRSRGQSFPIVQRNCTCEPRNRRRNEQPLMPPRTSCQLSTKIIPLKCGA